MNQKFRSVGSSTKINDIIKDFADGLALIELVEIMSGKSYPDKKPKPSTQRIQQLDNCSKALSFMKTCNINTQASPESKLLFFFHFKSIPH